MLYNQINNYNNIWNSFRHIDVHTYPVIGFGFDGGFSIFINQIMWKNIGIDVIRNALLKELGNEI